MTGVYVTTALCVLIHIVTSTEGCGEGFYGPTCSLPCGEHCNNSVCESDTVRGTYKCSFGCEDGWSGLSCERKCPIGCESCDQLTGTCAACKTGCCGKNCGPICAGDHDESGRLEMRTVYALLLVIPPFLIVGIVQAISVCWEKYKRRKEMKKTPGAYELCEEKNVTQTV